MTVAGALFILGCREVKEVTPIEKEIKVLHRGHTLMQYFKERIK
jgi:hypothetical protein